jgi:hypothetical protein
MSAHGESHAELEAKVQRLEDIEAIKQLKTRYARAADPTMKIEQMISLFAEDAVVDIERFGRYEGRTAIYEFLKSPVFTWMFHCMIPQVIDVAADGRTARGSWYLWELANLPNAKTQQSDAVWIAGVYNDEFVKSDGQWKFKHLNLKLEMLSPYADGWAKKRFVE